MGRNGPQSSLIQHGVLLVLMLSAIDSGMDYGYQIHRSLVADGLYVSEGSVYTGLLRSELRGLVTSDGNDAKLRQRRRYALTERGRNALRQELRDLQVVTERVFGNS